VYVVPQILRATLQCKNKWSDVSSMFIFSITTHAEIGSLWRQREEEEGGATMDYG
jgi:hypothetical protein